MTNRQRGALAAARYNAGRALLARGEDDRDEYLHIAREWLEAAGADVSGLDLDDVHGAIEMFGNGGEHDSTAAANG